jgi:hypothetical protein
MTLLRSLGLMLLCYERATREGGGGSLAMMRDGRVYIVD